MQFQQEYKQISLILYKFTVASEQHLSDSLSQRSQ